MNKVYMVFETGTVDCDIRPLGFYTSLDGAKAAQAKRLASLGKGKWETWVTEVKLDEVYDYAWQVNTID